MKKPIRIYGEAIHKHPLLLKRYIIIEKYTKPRIVIPAITNGTIEIWTNEDNFTSRNYGLPSVIHTTTYTITLNYGDKDGNATHSITYHKRTGQEKKIEIYEN